MNASASRLTLDQMLQLTKDPDNITWCQILKENNNELCANGWGQIQKNTSKDTVDIFYPGSEVPDTPKITNYGKTWVCYTNKPIDPKNWRNHPITEKQKAMIQELQEFSELPLPTFKGTTKGEASDYINQYIKTAHQSLDAIDHADNYGDRI